MVKRRQMSDKMSVFCSAPSHTLTLLSRNQPPSLRCCRDTVPGFTVITLLPLKSTESLLWGSVGTLWIEQVVQELKKLITFWKTPIWHQRRCRGLKTTSLWMTFIWAPCLFVQTTSNHWLNSKEWTTQCINTMMSKRWQEDKKTRRKWMIAEFFPWLRNKCVPQSHQTPKKNPYLSEIPCLHSSKKSHLLCQIWWMTDF